VSIIVIHESTCGAGGVVGGGAVGVPVAVGVVGLVSGFNR
jgi:hypothetical protein